MKVKDLKELLIGVDDEMDVLIPMTMEFDGYFKHPCVEESGVSEMGMSESDENLGITHSQFLLVPCGFFEEHDHKHEHN